jgi:hypothetical protein
MTMPDYFDQFFSAAIRSRVARTQVGVMAVRAT